MTIEERAWEKYPEVIKHHNLARIDINEEKRKMYIEVATEQKSIDIKRFVFLIDSLDVNKLYNEAQVLQDGREIHRAF